MKIFLTLFILFNYNFAYADHHHDHDHHDDHDDHSEERREGAVHVHGYNQVDLITNDNIMKITYSMPIVQLNDEHDEKNDGHDHDHHHHDNEEKTPDLSSFKNYNLVFETSKNANCKLTNYDSKIIEDKNDKNHKDVILDYTFKCKKINNLKFINFTAFKTFNDLEKINFKGIVNNKAFANLLTNEKSRINFK